MTFRRALAVLRRRQVREPEQRKDRLGDYMGAAMFGPRLSKDEQLRLQRAEVLRQLERRHERRFRRG